MTGKQQRDRHALTELPVRLYSALRTIRIYPPTNPQVTKNTDHILAILDQLLEQEDADITIGFSEQKILVNGNPLSEKDQQRPQVQGLSELFSILQVHTLTFHKGFTAADCVHFLELLSTATGSMAPEQPIKQLLQEAGIHSVSVDAKRYVAVHEVEQVGPGDQIGSGRGMKISEEDLTEFILSKAGDSDRASATALQQLLSGCNNAPSSGLRNLREQDALKTLVNELGHVTSTSEKAIRNPFAANSYKPC